ncbi:MAG: hypothetical protein IKX23_00605 [Treponema sp.]|nr:hypothetical protein [Treponema sp.]
MKKLFVLIAVLILSVVLFSCSNGTDSTCRIRISLESSDSSNVSVRVRLEDACGRSVDGAYILAGNKNGFYNPVLYNPENCFYEGKIELKEETIEVRIDSVLFSSPRKYEIPHKILLNKPFITVLSDAKGNSVMHGQKLDAAVPVQICWDTPDTDCLYLVEIKTPLETVYSVSTENTTVFISENSLKASTIYYVQVQAQKIFGNILFEGTDYYSISIIESGNFSFTTQ